MNSSPRKPPQGKSRAVKRRNLHTVSSGSPYTLGAEVTGEGVNFAVFSEHATRIELCLFSEDGSSEIDRLVLPERTGPVWHGSVSGLKAGALYGYRAHGTFAPEQGFRFNPNKLLLDPYTRELHGQWQDTNVTLGYQRGLADADLSFDDRDSAPAVPKSVVSHPDLFTKLQRHTQGQPGAELIYEAHSKGLTQQHPDVPESIRGTYEGLASDVMIEHLQSLGVTTIELLPVHAFLDDGFLLERGLTNYWGYNSISFFTPEPRYFGPSGIVGFKQMVERFKSAGIAVILDVVYNHTAEGNQNGPTLCYRGLDNSSYYRLVAGQPRYYVNDTGCGNTLNVSHPYVLRMVLDSLRFWVECMGVDGFRFDLATTIAREDHGFDPEGGFLDALRQDPVLSKVRLIAEPWDVGPGGYRLGGFPHEFSEWNDAYRDSVRRYWRGDEHSAQELGARLLASADRFDTAGRRAWSSLNFICSHDGFTLADITQYLERHNLANTENNRDGHTSNYSDNFGVEGPTDDPEVVKMRSRRQRNLLATLFFSQGTPMLLAGDELGNSQQGNNNAYCQDNPIGWIDWASSDNALLQFVRKLSDFRARHPSLRQTRFLHGEIIEGTEDADVEWTDAEGRELQWRDPGLSCLCLTVRCRNSDDYPDNQVDVVFLVFNRDADEIEVQLPAVPDNLIWYREIDTAAPESDATALPQIEKTPIAAQSVVAFSQKVV
ncbi:MAG: glycogen debranching protein GlgX [Granulosicoccus sp.]|nr:glycogen debranching protein GlgX [Granulosicoccus sp.]